MSSMTPRNTRQIYQERCDADVVVAYATTLDAIESVDTNQQREGIAAPDARELRGSRFALHRDLAHLGILMIERGIEL